MELDPVRRRVEPAIRRGLHLYWRFARGLTLGVRGLVIDAERRVFLVKHSYVAGWHLPGGGVEPGETLDAALARELREEGNIELTAPAVLFAIYFNRRVSRRDHVALVCRTLVSPERTAAAEPRDHRVRLLRCRFAARGRDRRDPRRIEEVFAGRAAAELW